MGCCYAIVSFFLFFFSSFLLLLSFCFILFEMRLSVLGVELEEAYVNC